MRFVDKYFVQAFIAENVINVIIEEKYELHDLFGLKSRIVSRIRHHENGVPAFVRSFLVTSGCR